MKTSPFSFSQIKVVLLVVSLFLLNVIWQNNLSSIFANLHFSSFVNGMIEALLKTVLIVGLGIFLTYYLKISNEINSLIKKALNIIKR